MKKSKTSTEHNVHQRDYDAKVQELRDAPKFRDYIRLLLDNADDEDWTYEKHMNLIYRKRHKDKKYGRNKDVDSE